MAKFNLEKILEEYPFGVKDYDKSKAKHCDKPCKYQAALDELAGEVLEPWFDYFGIVDDAKPSMLQYWLPKWKEEIEQGKRRGVRQLATFINSAVFNYNTRRITQETGLKESSAATYATRFYLQNYKAINDKMREVLKDFLL